RFPQLLDRNDLWKLLVVITARKAVDVMKHENRKKRGGGIVVGESAVLPQTSASGEGGINQAVSPDPSPEFAVQVAEECRRLLRSLEDATLRSVAVWKMEGYSNDEIAAKLGCVPRTVERKLRVIRSLWAPEVLS